MSGARASRLVLSGPTRAPAIAVSDVLRVVLSGSARAVRGPRLTYRGVVPGPTLGDINNDGIVDVV
eukprot:3835465-Rhodomonas_salina.2